MKQSVATYRGMNTAFIRALICLLGEGLPSADWNAQPQIIRLWWGEEGIQVTVAPGDRVRLVPTPEGLVFDHIEERPETVNPEGMG